MSARNVGITCGSGHASACSSFSIRVRASELAATIEPDDRLKFRDSKRYRDRLVQAQKSTGEKDALIVMAGTLTGLEVVAAAFEFRFMGGSMGAVVGERFVRAVEHCLEHRDAAGVLLFEWRRAHAGGPVLTPADVEDQRRAGASRQGAACRSSR